MCYQFVVQDEPNENWSLITDRLYKRYLKLEELAKANELMGKIQTKFKQISIKCIEIDEEKSDLPKVEDNLFSLFEDLFNCFFECTDEAKGLFEWRKEHEEGITEKDYRPVFTIITELPRHAYESMRSLTEYDELEGPPFWCSDEEFTWRFKDISHAQNRQCRPKPFQVLVKWIRGQ